MGKYAIGRKSLILILLVASTWSKSTKRAETPITVTDVLAGTYSPRSFSGTWISEKLLQYKNATDLWTYDIETEERLLKFDGSNLNHSDYSFSADGRFILQKYEVEYIWRHSQKAFYDIFDTTTESWQQIYPKELESPDKLMLFTWAPTGNGFAYVHNGNVYYRPNATEEGKEAEYKITSSGTEDGKIVNGHTDWVYEEEMFGDSAALWFSPNSEYLTFIEFDDSLVEDFQYPMYGEPGDREHTYPRWVKLYYPKAGTGNPTVKMFVTNLSTESTTQVTYSIDEEEDFRYYIGTSFWRTDASFFLIHLNRKQSVAQWYDCSPTTAVCSLTDPVISQEEPNGWVDVVHPTFSSDKQKVLVIFPRKIGDFTYRQIDLIDLTEKTRTPITQAPISVDSILAWNEPDRIIYFSGTGLNGEVKSPSDTQVYSVPQVANSNPTCITCSLTNSDNSNCKANRVSLNPTFTDFVHFCNGPGIPEVYIRKLDTPSEIFRTVENNADLRNKLADVKLPTVVDEEVEVDDGLFTARARLFLPSDFDENKKYPLLIDVYAGPDSQQIGENFGVTWTTSLVSDRQIILGLIDGRGSGRQSKEQLFQLNRRLGTVEIEDQIAVTAELIRRHSYINANETAIWGWSYGGYATSMVMATDTENVFKCGISVAPVTSWLYYDTIYTERYMSLPTDEDNWDGYNVSEVTTHVENFRNKKFFLVHGNADDNVHYQQSMILSRALEQADILFRQLSYPNEDHSIGGRGMRKHLYHSLENFLFNDCFYIQENTRSNSISLFTKSTTVSSIIFVGFSSLFYNNYYFR